ncbi:IclR family transcriptional regulator [uncultured Streptomyces sp.]|uniref:IclR family transcriptional regulator n=1 Tax=uncultured Streptomyces sp. TaxID=174707 RepID=UPI0026182F87|nr:IclR family transcriptional regulator [uncultured Streptomyces sp.]
MVTQILTSSLKTLEVLAALADEPRGVGASELARRIGGNRGYVHRQLVTLCAGGWIEQAEDGTYRLSLRVSRLSDAAFTQAGLGHRATAALEELAAEVDETVSLAVLDGDSARIVQRVEVDRLLRVDARIEARMPISDTASGRVLTAWALPHDLDALRDAGVPTATDEELEHIRRDGYALSLPNRLEPTVAVAAPVFDARRRALAALSVVGPMVRFDAEAAAASTLACAARVTAIVSGRR